MLAGEPLEGGLPIDVGSKRALVLVMERHVENGRNVYSRRCRVRCLDLITLGLL